MSNLKEILDLFIQIGWVSIPLIILILIIHDPDRAEKIKELFFLPTFLLFKRGARQYMAAKVGHSSTQFVKREILPLLPSIPNIKIQVKWVLASSDEILGKEGALVLCMHETNDQTRNILAATQLALPRIVCSTARANMSKDLEEAIDLTLLKKLATALGKHAKPVFQEYFLGAEGEANLTLKENYSKLVALDNHGIFVAIFLEELESLGEQLHASGDISDKTEDIAELIEFLLAEARRGIGEDIRLEYFSANFQLGIILLAITKTITTWGVSPYVSRIDQNIKQGCDSIYIIAYQKASHFLEKILNTIKADNRLTLKKVVSPSVYSHKTQRNEQWKIAQLQCNPLFVDTAFVDRVKAINISEGSVVNGKVLDVSESIAVVNILGLNGVIPKYECDWNRVKDCHDILKEGEQREFLVKTIDEEKGVLSLSLRLPGKDPWQKTKVPIVGEHIDIKVLSCDGNCYYCITADGLGVLLPRIEVSWLEPVDFKDSKLVGQDITLVVIKRDDGERMLVGSLRQVEEDPWPSIHKSLPKDTSLRGIVKEIYPNSVRVTLPNGLEGIIPGSCLQTAGYEYADFNETMVVGQKLDVVVTKVFLNKRRIRLNLLRNIEQKPN